MHSTFADIKAIQRTQNKAVGYVYKSGMFEANHELINTPIPSGCIYASTQDLYKFYRGIHQHTLVNKLSVASLFNKDTDADALPSVKSYYGYGFETTEQRNAFSIGHNGTNLGAGSDFQYYPDRDTYVIVLSNHGSTSARDVADHIRDLLIPN